MNTCPNLEKKAVSNELLDFLRSPDRIVKVSFHLFYDKVWEEEDGLKEELFNFKQNVERI